MNVFINASPCSAVFGSTEVSGFDAGAAFIALSTPGWRIVSKAWPPGSGLNWNFIGGSFGDGAVPPAADAFDGEFISSMLILLMSVNAYVALIPLRSAVSIFWLETNVTPCPILAAAARASFSENKSSTEALLL